MKKLLYYAGVMIVIVILLPMIIVRSCGPAPEKPKPQADEKAPPEMAYEITVYNRDEDKVEIMDLEEYIKCVVAAEMPADFDMEALKAQAVAARTFAYGRMSGVYRSKQGVHDGIEICTDSTHCQAYISKESALKKWNILFASRNWRKIDRAVNETKGLIAVYQGNIANTLFHASSAGKTENAEDVWDGKNVPYLQSVESNGDETSKSFITSVMFSTGELADKITKAFPDTVLDEGAVEDIEILDHTVGGRVKTLRIGDLLLKGTEFRSIMGLRSACFSIEAVDESLLKITTRGHGHGVGMSQWGANSLAKTGGTFREIMQHYYTGIDIISISEYEALTSRGR